MTALIDNLDNPTGYYFYFDDYTVPAAGSDNRFRGHPIRCLAY